MDDTKSCLKNNITISKEATIIEITMQVYRVQVVNGHVVLVSITMEIRFHEISYDFSIWTTKKIKA